MATYEVPVGLIILIPSPHGDLLLAEGQWATAHTIELGVVKDFRP